MRSKLVVIAVALSALGPVGRAQELAPASTGRHIEVVAAFLGWPVSDLGVTRADAGPEPGRVQVHGAAQPPDSAEGTRARVSFRAVIDPAEGLVYLLRASGGAIAKVDTSSMPTIDRDAETYARAHFAQWSEATTLVHRVHKTSGSHILFWENRTASGACTGAWCSVIVSESCGGIVGFVQQTAFRSVPESSVAVCQEVAEGAALAALRANLPADLDLSVMEASLILSYFRAPDQGPVWLVRVAAGLVGHPQAAPKDVCAVIVDGMTARVLEVAR